MTKLEKIMLVLVIIFIIEMVLIMIYLSFSMNTLPQNTSVPIDFLEYGD